MRPLSGTIVLDLSRMLPGAVLARLLVDLGARVIRVEEPGVGDLMRHAPPLVDGVGAGYRALVRGTESVCLDLRQAEGREAVRRLARHADVLIESFRPGTMARWGLGPEDLAALNARLISLSLPAFGSGSQAVAHDLNLVAASGLLALLPDAGDGSLPQVQLADVTTGLLAGNALLAALLQRQRTQQGLHLEQPLATGPLPFLAWAAADAAASRPGLPATVLAGQAAGYGVYACLDEARLAVGAIEPKFWATFCEVVGLPDLADGGLAVGPAGAAIRARVAERLAAPPRAAWLAALAPHNLPVGPVNGVAEGASPEAPWLPTWAPEGALAVPALGADTERVLAEFGD